MITITIKTDNAAFHDYYEEVARILECLAKNSYTITNGTRLRDSNGNSVGEVKLTGKDRQR